MAEYSMIIQSSFFFLKFLRICCPHLRKEFSKNFSCFFFVKIIRNNTYNIL